MIRFAGAFCLLVLALATVASADPVDDRASAPAAVATQWAASRQEGNPLWKIPLSALAATRDRPLFSASRRPPAPAVVAAPTPPPNSPPPPPAPPERPALTLLGTIVSPSTSVAMFKDTATQAVTRLRKGEATSGWLLKTVKLRSVVVEKGDQSAILALPNRLDAGEQPSPNPLAFGERRNKQ